MRALLLLAVGALAACAGSTSAVTGPDAELIGGDAAGETYAAVGALRDETGSVFCTATLVAPRFVVTAQHCIEGGSEEMPEEHDPRKTTFALGPDATSPVRAVTLKKWWRAPDFPHPEREEYASDVMLAELAEPVTDVTPIPIDARVLDTTQLGDAFEIVGFGVRAADGLDAPEGKREVGAMKLVATEGNAFEKQYGSRAAFDEVLAKLDPEAAADGVGDRFWPRVDLHAGYEALAYGAKAESCYSDSGGPLLRVDGGKRTVVGVVSQGFNGYASSCLHLGTIFATFGPETRAFLATKLR